jgi:hypothetical protein
MTLLNRSAATTGILLRHLGLAAGPSDDASGQSSHDPYLRSRPPPCRREFWQAGAVVDTAGPAAADSGRAEADSGWRALLGFWDVVGQQPQRQPGLAFEQLYDRGWDRRLAAGLPGSWGQRNGNWMVVPGARATASTSRVACSTARCPARSPGRPSGRPNG